jgi:hypothetical protein
MQDESIVLTFLRFVEEDPQTYFSKEKDMLQDLGFSGLLLCYGPLFLVVGGFIAFAIT